MGEESLKRNHSKEASTIARNYHQLHKGIDDGGERTEQKGEFAGPGEGDLEKNGRAIQKNRKHHSNDGKNGLKIDFRGKTN